jgi:hypothetical protein
MLHRKACSRVCPLALWSNRHGNRPCAVSFRGRAASEDFTTVADGRSVMDGHMAAGIHYSGGWTLCGGWTPDRRHSRLSVGPIQTPAEPAPVPPPPGRRRRGRPGLCLALWYAGRTPAGAGRHTRSAAAPPPRFQSFQSDRHDRKPSCEAFTISAFTMNTLIVNASQEGLQSSPGRHTRSAAAPPPSRASAADREAPE